MKWLPGSCALAVLWLCPALSEGGWNDSSESRSNWRISFGVGSSSHWGSPYHDRWGYPRHDRWGHHSRFHNSWYRDRWHRDPWFHDRWHRDPWHYDPWYDGSGVSWTWTSPLIRHRDPWTHRAVPHATALTVEPAAPSPSDRAHSAFENPSTRTSAESASDAENGDDESDSVDGAVLAGEGLAALARTDYEVAVSRLRKAFAEDPTAAARAAENARFRATCDELKESLLYQYPYALNVADGQFLRAVLFLYTGDRASAAYTAQAIRDDSISTTRLQTVAGH